MNRRSFLKKAALTAGALSAGHLLSAATTTPREKLNCVQIGCGGRGMSHLDWLVGASKDNLVAIVDPDERRLAAVKKWLDERGRDSSKVQAFTDYRVMFDKIGKSIDAVTIAAPNHHHAPASMLAMDLGKGVYCEKPLCHDIAQARKLREMARKSKAPTQMGSQGHCEEGYHRLCEFVAAGIVGNITETHSWTDRANGGIGPRPAAEKPPAELHWDEWIGPAPFRKFHSDLHPHEWHGWRDFGNGSLGNMGCHVLDGVFWALKLGHPLSVEMEDVRDGSEERFPMGSRVRWDFPARGAMPALKVYWHEGFKQGVRAASNSALGEGQNLPPLLTQLKKQYPDEEFDTNGTLYVGEKGILYTGTYGGKMRLLPTEKMESLTQPPKTLPRPNNVFEDFLDACRAGKKETAVSFDYAAQMTEFVLLGNLAQEAGAGKKLEWDGPRMKVTNLPEMNQWVKRPSRKGWRA